MPRLDIDQDVLAEFESLALITARRVYHRLGRYDQLPRESQLVRDAARLLNLVDDRPPSTIYTPSARSLRFSRWQTRTEVQQGHTPVSPLPSAPNGNLPHAVEPSVAPAAPMLLSELTIVELLALITCIGCENEFSNLVVMSCCKLQMCMVCIGRWIMQPREGELSGQALSFAARFNCPKCHFALSPDLRTTEHVRLVAHIVIEHGHTGILEGERSLSEAVHQLARAVSRPVKDYNQRLMELGMAWLIEAQHVRYLKDSGKAWKSASRGLVNRKATFLDLFGNVLFIDFEDLLSDDPEYLPEHE